MIVKTFRDVICDNKSLINDWKKHIKFMLTTDNYDEYDGDGYRKYLDGIYSQMNTHEVLFVQATPNDCDYDIEVFWSNKNDDEQFFEPFETLTLEQARMVFEQVSDNKGTARNRQISLIEDMFDNGYDVPYNFCIDSIKGNITQRVTENTSQIGEVGLYCSDEGMYLSVFFPNKIEPCKTFDFPLDKMSYQELIDIEDAMVKC